MDLTPSDIYELNFNAAVVLCIGFLCFSGSVWSHPKKTNSNLTHIKRGKRETF